MACSISITSVTGIPAVPNSTTTSTIHVTGTLTGTCAPTPNGAVEVVVEAICGSNSAKASATPDSGRKLVRRYSPALHLPPRHQGHGFLRYRPDLYGRIRRELAVSGRLSDGVNQRGGGRLQSRRNPQCHAHSEYCDGSPNSGWAMALRRWFARTA